MLSCMAAPSQWFRTLLDRSPEVYFRYDLRPTAAFVYISPSVRTLVGREPDEFLRDPELCLKLVPAAARRQLRRLVHARRGMSLCVSVLRDGIAVPVDVRTVTVVRAGRVVAIEGVARLAGAGAANHVAPGTGEPVQQRLAALLVEVHELLHRVLPSGTPANTTSNAPWGEAADGAARSAAPARLVLGALVFDCDRLQVFENGQLMPLTPRETGVLRYLLERKGRVVTREQLLQDVWHYSYTGDDRTVDVHVSRLRRKLPSLRGRIVAIRRIGYRLDDDEEAAAPGDADAPAIDVPRVRTGS